jgi:hypothetical protein
MEIMMEKRVHWNKYKITLFLIVLTGVILSAGGRAFAASAVSVGTIDYENLEMQLFYNGNTIIYYSTDNSTWTEVDGDYNSATKSCLMDISWISSTSDVILYLKGDVVKTVKTLTLPSQNTTFEVIYDKSEGTFTFNNAEEATSFEWRKTTDYKWNSVNVDENSGSYQNFLNMMEYFRVKGIKIAIRIPQSIGSGLNDVGMRPSREVTVSVTARANAPTIRINASKLTLSTTTSMEYYDTTSGLWIDCTGSMSLDEIAPKVLYENGAESVTLKIRTAATSSSPFSKTAFVSIPGQSAAPSIGDSSAEVTYYYMNSKLMLQFNKASAAIPYEYAVIRSGYDFDASSASWRSVNSSSLLTISQSAVPSGSRIYVRKKGTDANSSNNTSLVLASAARSFAVNY